MPLPQETEVIVLTAAGYAMRRETTGWKRQNKPGGPGSGMIQAFDVLTALVAPQGARGHLLYLPYSGRLAQVSPAEIPVQSRLGKGVQLQHLSRDPAVGVVLVPGSLLG